MVSLDLEDVFWLDNEVRHPPVESGRGGDMAALCQRQHVEESIWFFSECHLIYWLGSEEIDMETGWFLNNYMVLLFFYVILFSKATFLFKK